MTKPEEQADAQATSIDAEGTTPWTDEVEPRPRPAGIAKGLRVTCKNAQIQDCAGAWLVRGQRREQLPRKPRATRETIDKLLQAAGGEVYATYPLVNITVQERTFYAQSSIWYWMQP